MNGSRTAEVAQQVRELTRALSELPVRGSGAAPADAAQVDLIADLEILKCAAEAAQAVVAAQLYDARVADHAAQGVPAARRGRGVAHEIALARRESPHRGRMHLGLARAVAGSRGDVDGLPGLRSAWAAGLITEHRVTQVVARLIHLDGAGRSGVDGHLAGSPEAVADLVAMSDREAVAAADSWVYEHDRAGYVARRRAAEADRHVSSRPAPDTMLRLSALLPVAEGVAVVAALRSAAERARNDGDHRSRSQVMADTLVGRVTGRDALTDGPEGSVSVTVPLDVLVDDGPGRDAPGWVDGYGAVPADLARSLAADVVEGAATGSAAACFRRGFTDPAGRLVAMESASRLFPPGLAHFLRGRDRFCRHPWCEAPIRHIDHVLAAGEGGATSADNGQGLCEACNHAKQAPGWHAKARSDPDGTHVVETTTPSGHVHESRPPPALPRHAQRAEARPADRNTRAGDTVGQQAGRAARRR